MWLNLEKISLDYVFYSQAALIRQLALAKRQYGVTLDCAKNVPH